MTDNDQDEPTGRRLQRRARFANGESAPAAGTEHAHQNSAHEWRDSATMILRLPGSGMIAKLRRPSLVAMAALPNGVPNPLSDAVIRLMMREEPADNPTEQRKLFIRNYQAMIEVAALCFVSPRLITDRAPDYDHDEIGPQDLSDRDYPWLYFTFVEGMAAQLDSFRTNERTDHDAIAAL